MNSKQNKFKTDSSQNQPQTAVCESLKVALDVHASFIMVAWQIEGSKPKPPQKFQPQAFLEWVAKQVTAAYKVTSCYEAGPTGFWLHRKLVALGVSNLVVCPTCLDSRYQGVNTDKTDALELLSRLDRYLVGNHKVFSVVRIPSQEEEKRRAFSRQRQQLQAHRLSLASMGRSLMLLQGHRQSNNWWRGAHWQRLQEELPPWLIERLCVYHKLIESVEEQLKGMIKEMEAKAPEKLPKGFGALTHEQIESEVCDWNRFKKWRQLGGYSGLTGGVSARGEQLADLSITKVGNRRLRTSLIELSWRMVFYQRGYWLVKKWEKILLNPKAHARRRKQVIVAFARQLFIDLWKWKTGRATPESLGWVMAAS